MIKNLNIKKFKVLENENLDIRPLTVFCGENSSGKSTAIRAMLFFGNGSFDKSSYYSFNAIYELHDDYKYIELEDSNGLIVKAYGANSVYADKPANLDFNPTLLCAERIGPRKVYESINNTYDFIDMHGRLAPFFYHQKQNDNISELAIDNMEDTTLRSQVAYWLNHILGTIVKTENIQDNIIVSYKGQDDIEYYSPLNTGFGTSMVFPILIACLTAKIGDTVIIENPEVHLHPKAQSKLADFFAFIAQKGVQVILETHCEHLIYKLCYNINKNVIDNNDIKYKIDHDKVVFQYKEINKPFQTIYTDEKGMFVNKENALIEFPSGFFDATLEKYMSIF